MRALVALLALALSTWPGTAVAEPAAAAPAEASGADIQSLARQYVMVGGSEDLFLEGSAYGFRESARADGIEFTPTQWRRMRTALNEAFRPAADMFIAEVTTFFAANHTREDILAALAFYRSPAGARYRASSVAYSFPLSAYLSSEGRVALIDAAPAHSLDAGRLTQARSLAQILSDKMHASERAVINLTNLGMDGLSDYIARSLAEDLEEADLNAAIEWENSPASMRLEGPSAERVLTIQTAMARAVVAIDLERIRQAFEDVMRETPA